MKPNILIFCVDEMRADHLGCSGNKIVKTPNLDKLAEKGTYFPNAFCNNPICMPARASIFTGLLPRDHGLRVNGQSLNKAIPTLAGVLADNGYRTHSAGKLHLTPWMRPENEDARIDLYPECMQYWNNGLIEKVPTPYYGFQSVDFVGGHTSFSYGEHIEWIKEQGGDPNMVSGHLLSEDMNKHCYKMALPEEFHYNRFISNSAIREICSDVDKPFFIWCSFPDPHGPWGPPAPYCDMYDPEDMPVPDINKNELELLPPFYKDVLNGDIKPNGCDNSGITNKHWQEILAMNYAMITHLDAEVGRVMDSLKESGKMDNTIILFVSDHGDMMGDHRLIYKAFYTFKGCVNIPLLIKAPGMPEGKVNHNLISQIDIMPGVLDLCNIPLPGADWAEVKTSFERGALVPLGNYPGYIFRPMLESINESIRDSVVIENDDPTTGFNVRCLVTEKYRLSVYPNSEHGELFDRENDPGEFYNLWYKEDFSQTRNKLVLQLLNDYSKDTPCYPIPYWNS